MQHGKVEGALSWSNPASGRPALLSVTQWRIPRRSYELWDTLSLLAGIEITPAHHPNACPDWDATSLHLRNLSGQAGVAKTSSTGSSSTKDFAPSPCYTGPDHDLWGSEHSATEVMTKSFAGKEQEEENAEMRIVVVCKDRSPLGENQQGSLWPYSNYSSKTALDL